MCVPLSESKVLWEMACSLVYCEVYIFPSFSENRQTLNQAHQGMAVKKERNLKKAENHHHWTAVPRTIRHTEFNRLETYF